MTIQTIVFDSAWLTPSGLVSYQLDGSEEDGCADADDLDPSRHRPGCFRERLLRRSDPFVEALHVNRLAHSCNTRHGSSPGRATRSRAPSYRPSTHRPRPAPLPRRAGRPARSGSGRTSERGRSGSGNRPRTASGASRIGSATGTPARRALEVDHRIAAGAPGIKAAGQGPNPLDAPSPYEHRRP